MTNRDDYIAYQIEILTALKAGKTLQYKYIMVSTCTTWSVQDSDVSTLNFSAYKYRVKPETLEEAADAHADNHGYPYAPTAPAAIQRASFITGANWGRGNPSDNV